MNTTSAGHIDPCTRLILDFIRGGVPGNPSGEAEGNYNAYFAHIKSTTALGKMTLAEIDVFQAAMLALDSRSSAIGGYQFLRKTLWALRAKPRLNLLLGDFFTPELQDRLAVELMVGRGYSAWWRGNLANDEFVSRLSEEWASLPDPMNGGKSHYDGDPVGNRASTTLAAVYDMLGRARAVQEAPAQLPAEPTPAISDAQRVSEIAAELLAIGTRLARPAGKPS